MKKITLINLLLLITFSLLGQGSTSRVLTGKIADQRGEPIIGASIKEKDGKSIAISDVNGAFRINVSVDPATEIEASYIGYKTLAIKVEGKDNLRITMTEDAKSLSELVIIGYGTQKRSSLTSSIETIKSTDILKMPTPNLDEALVGQVAGLSVSSYSGDPSSARESRINIRGIHDNPLLVIDGVPRFAENTSDAEMRLSDLNPDDVESISILKDAAAAAVYGSRAARGVILVTTKRGRGDKKIRINYRGQFNSQEATKFPKFLNAYEYAKLFNQAYGNSDATFQNRYQPYSEEVLDAIRTNSEPNKYGNKDLLDYLKDHGYSTSHSLSVSGGNKDITYYASFGYTKSEGLYSGVGRDRYNYSAKLDANLIKGLKLSIDVLGSRSDNKNTSYTTIDAAFNLDPTQVLEYTDGKLASINSGNPLIAAKGLGGYIQNKMRLSTFTATLKYDVQQVKGLSAYIRGTFEDNRFSTKNFNKPVTLYMEDPNNTGMIIEDSKTVYPKAQVSLTRGERNVDNKLYEIGANYDRTFSEKHNVSGMLVANYQRTDNDFLEGLNSNLSGVYPEIIGTGVSGEDVTVNGVESSTERASLIGRATYNFDSRYFFETSFRYDGSTRLHPDNRWKFFPSVSASWIASNEKFFKKWDQDILSNLKFRGSIGVLGDETTVPNYSYETRYIFSPSSGYQMGESYKQSIILSPDALPNPDLEFEERKSYNLAVDLGFWDNRISVTYENYWRYRSNMLAPAPSYLYPISAGSGGRQPYINMGEIKEWGWDFTVNHRNTIGNVKYNLDFIISKTDNKYVDYGDESSLSEYRQKKGKPAYSWNLYESAGLFQTQEEIDNYPVDQDGKGNKTIAPGDIKYIDQNGDDKITKEDLVYVKNASYPDYTFSIKVGAEYKGFFVNAMFQGVSGYKQLLSETYTLYNNTLQRFQTYHRDESWTTDNPNARYPRLKFANANDNNRESSTFWIEDCNYIRLKSLTIGYSMPTKIVQKMKLSSMSISLQGSNLVTWSSLKGMDPESLRGYPIQRSYGISLNLGF